VYSGVFELVKHDQRRRSWESAVHRQAVTGRATARLPAAILLSMCGRYTVTRPGDVLAEVWHDLDETALAPAAPPSVDSLPPRYNLAPTQAAPLVTRGERYAELGLARWGLRAGAGGAKPLINARLETAAELASFSDAFARRRCLVPADGFYEWSRGSGQPHWFWIDGRAGFCFAGLWVPGAWEAAPAPRAGRDTARPGDAVQVDRAFCILTTRARPPVEELHDRMPVILHPSSYGLWLAQGPLAQHDLSELSTAAAELSLSRRPVSRRVNRVDADEPALLEPSAPAPENLSLF
jgi:putative SOS response-associated peptidase YedK